MENEWSSLIRYLPQGWQEQARELKAITRGREIKTADDLLSLNLLYLTNGGSFQATSEMMRLTGGKSLNKNAVRKRIMGSWEWLRWMAQTLCREQGFVIPKPEWLGNKRIILTDGSDMALRGSKGSDYRLHYVFDLFNFACRSMEVTTTKEGERLSRHEVRTDDIFIADRAYCTISGMEHVLAGAGDFILRLRAKAFHLYDEGGKKLELLPMFSQLQALESLSVSCFYKLATGEQRPIRIVAMKKDAQALESGRRKQLRKASRNQLGQVKAETMAFNEYIVLATGLAYDEAQILELYRTRWQIEQVFYRLKTLFDFGEVPSSNPNSVRAWFYGKLLVAALCQSMIQAESFSPTEERIFLGVATKKHSE